MNLTKWFGRKVSAPTKSGSHSHYCPQCKGHKYCPQVTHCKRPEESICWDCLGLSKEIKREK